ncbi:MAG: NAD-dependent epimerase/dehydratase family protein [Bdellovibrionales bacterium]|nr:NAD-dependent epimerase/dehydratase family protein [Bdellovibrionales bacterium]
MKVFVTGGAGFIGSHLCENLLNRGDEVTAYDNLSLGRKEFLKPLLSRPSFSFVENDLLKDVDLAQRLKGYDLVFHLAANSDISLGSSRTDLDLKQSVMATYNLLEAMRGAGVGRLIFSSTSAIYGEAELKPTPETYGPLVPISFYGAGKLSAESLICAYAHHYGIRSWIYRFANVVGAHLTHGAIHDFLQRLKADPSVLKVLGDGRQRKSYLHVTDCIEGMLFGFHTAKDEVNLFNLASRGVTEVRWIAEQVVAQVNASARIEYGSEDRGWSGDVPYSWLDSGKLANLGWKAKVESSVAVEMSVREALQWQNRS